jgi:Na+-driven multidrug efflux pump
VGKGESNVGRVAAGVASGDSNVVGAAVGAVVAETCGVSTDLLQAVKSSSTVTTFAIRRPSLYDIPQILRLKKEITGRSGDL